MRRSFLILVLTVLIGSAGAATPLFPSGLVVDRDGSLLVAHKGVRSVDRYTPDGLSRLSSVVLNEAPTGLVVDPATGVVYVTAFDAVVGRSMLYRIVGGQVEKSVVAPYGATAPVWSNGVLYVAGQFDERVVEFDPLTLTAKRETKVLREPKAMAATEDYLFVVNFLPAQAADLEVVAAELSVIDRKDFKVIKNIKFANGSNALRDVVVTDDGRYVLVSHNLGRFTVPTSQLQQGWMNTSAVSVVDAKALTYLGAVIVDEPNRGAAGTWGVVQSGDKLLVSHSGTHDISVIDYPKFVAKLSSYKGGVETLAYDLRFLYGLRERVPLVGNGPRAMAIKGGKAYVPTYFSDTLNVVDLASNQVSTVAWNTGRVETLEQVGERVFNDAKYCFQNWQSCNGCHPGDARTDGMNWDLMNDGIGNPKNCKSLLFSIQTPPSMISGIRVSATLANRKGFTHIQFSSIPEALALAVDAYTGGLLAVPSPFLVNGQLSAKAQEGRKVFEKLGCDVCHSGPYFTDMKMHRIGTNIEFANGWDTPTLREVWRTAPYLFDGRAATMQEVFAVHKHGIEKRVSDKDMEALVEYVNSL